MINHSVDLGKQTAYLVLGWKHIIAGSQFLELKVPEWNYLGHYADVER